ncbi:hypothetical protein [Bdellovibrio sp. HCB337]|uniref:hypothetical protein n=1 Tax=Bdellovibrio sp. HCB337 TaxID=3394358 RepID=UPI0039A4823C
MKIFAALLAGVLFMNLNSAHAGAGSSLFVKSGETLIDVQSLIDNEEDVQAQYGYEDFCYTGSADAVVAKMTAWKKTDLFFSGGGGGFELVGLRINRGIVSYDIMMRLADEVAQGEFRNVIIKACK